MKNKFILSLILLTVMFVYHTYAQKVATFEESAKQGRSYQRLDSLYKSAVHANTDLAVFKTRPQQDSLQKAYAIFIQDLGAFLRANNFKWGGPVKCFNRIYFAKTER